MRTDICGLDKIGGKTITKAEFWEDHTEGNILQAVTITFTDKSTLEIWFDDSVCSVPEIKTFFLEESNG